MVSVVALVAERGRGGQEEGGGDHEGDEGEAEEEEGVRDHVASVCVGEAGEDGDGGGGGAETAGERRHDLRGVEGW